MTLSGAKVEVGAFRPPHSSDHKRQCLTYVARLLRYRRLSKSSMHSSPRHPPCQLDQKAWTSFFRIAEAIPPLRSPRPNFLRSSASSLSFNPDIGSSYLAAFVITFLQIHSFASIRNKCEKSVNHVLLPAVSIVQMSNALAWNLSLRRSFMHQRWLAGIRKRLLGIG